MRRDVRWLVVALVGCALVGCALVGCALVGCALIGCALIGCAPSTAVSPSGLPPSGPSSKAEPVPVSVAEDEDASQPKAAPEPDRGPQVDEHGLAWGGDYERTWRKPIPDADLYMPDDVAVGPNGEAYLVGNHYQGRSAAEPALLKFAADGSVAWTWTPPSTDYEDVTRLAVGANGAVHVLSSKDDGSGGQTIVRTFEADGTLRWTKTWGVMGSKRAKDLVWGNDMTRAADGTLYVAGGARLRKTAPAVLTALDAEGTIRWQDTWERDEHPKRVAAGDDGVYTLGWATRAIAGTCDEYVTTFHDPDGTLLRDARWACAPGTEMQQFILPSGDVVIAGYDRDRIAFVTRRAFDGTERWTHRMEDPVTWCCRVAVTDAAIFMAGLPGSGPPDHAPVRRTSLFLAEYALDGTERWHAQWDSGREDQANAIAAGAGHLLLIETARGFDHRYAEPPALVRWTTRPPGHGS